VTHDLVRGANAFEDAMESLAMFRAVGLAPNTVLFVCLTKANIDEVDDLIALAEEYEVGMLVFSQWQRQGNAANTPWASIAPSTEQWVATGEKIMAYKHPRLRVHGNFFGDLTNGGPLCLDSPLFPKHIYYYNAFPRITPQGDILADQLWVDRDWVLGNVKTGDNFDSVFKTAKFHDQLNMMRARTQAIDECAACEWKGLCEAGSAGHTYAEYGHMNAKDLFCDSRKYWFERYVQRQMERI
jgi:radical SAM protein with 4Fe4S-binding SPASM domain